MFKWFRKRSDKPFETKPTNHALADLKRARMGFGFSVLTAIIGVKMGPATLGPTLAYIGAGLTLLVGTLRAGVYFDFYSRRSNADNQGTRVTQGFEKYWSKTPLRHLSLWKIENDRRDETLRALFTKLDERINAATEDEAKDKRKKDHGAYTQILNSLNPNNHLMPAASAGLLTVSWGRIIFKSFNDGTLSLRFLAGMVPSILSAAAFTLVHLSSYAIKKQAGGTSNPVFDQINTRLERTPLRYLTAWKLRRELKRLDKLEISDELTQDMRELALDKNLEIISRSANFKPDNMLSKLFNGAAPVVVTVVVPAEETPAIPPAAVIEAVPVDPTPRGLG